MKAQHAIVGVEKYTSALYDALPEGGVLARFGVGYDGLDLKQATAKGLLCTNTPGVLDQSVAEHAIALILAGARRVGPLARKMQDGRWEPEVGWELNGRTLALIGCGPIGCQTARIAAFGFGMQVVGCEIRSVDVEQMGRKYGFDRIEKEFAEAVREADFVSLHIPSTPENHHFINQVRLDQIPEEAMLVNVARGPLIDEAALYQTLQAGQLRGALLDVYTQEPYEPVDQARDLRDLDCVVMTPHVASSTVEACERMASRAMYNIQMAIEQQFGKMDLLNREILQDA